MLLPLLFCLPLLARTLAAPPVAPPAATTTKAPSAPPRFAPLPPGTFTNPFVTSRTAADPWIVWRDGFYYFTFTTGGGVEIWKSPTLTGLDRGEKKTVWRAPASGPNSRDVWAPEIHFVGNRCYVVYAATDENRSDANRRLFVLEAETNDPLGPYRDRGRIVLPDADFYAIDGTYFEHEGRLYLVWSGRPGPGGGAQNIYLAPMANAWTPSGPRVLLSTPTYPWEKAGWWVNEGPEILRHDGRVFLAYSASGGTTPDYCLGLLTFSGGSVTDPAAWRKSPVPVFSQYTGPDGAIYTPGHNAFCKSPNGTEDWIVYHAKDAVDHNWGGRTARAQKIAWNGDGTPAFGHPVPPGVPLAVPSGEPGSGRVPAGSGTGLLARYFAALDFSAAPAPRTRIDPTVHFDWGLGGPSALDGIVDGFAVRWEGRIEPRYSDTYTFQTYADDGVRLWVDGRKLIDHWTDRAAGADQGTIPLVAKRRYAIRLEYYERNDRARVSLAWSSPRQPFEIVPRSQLYLPSAQAAGRKSPTAGNNGPRTRKGER